MAKVNSELLDASIANLLAYSRGEKITVGDVTKQGKKRNFQETVELQVTLKNWDTNKDKRFSGAHQLPNAPRPNLKVCMLANEMHHGKCKEIGVYSLNVEDLKKFNRNKKLIKRKLVAKYDAFLASNTLLKQIPRLMGGPLLQRAGKFPTTIGPTDDIQAKIDTVKSTIKWQMKKVLCLATAVGHVGMTEEQLKANIVMAINFLVSLLKKNWLNVKLLYIKSSMGPSFCIYF